MDVRSIDYSYLQRAGESGGAGEVRLLPRYSGRGMYGANCFALAAGEKRMLLTFLMRLGVEAVQDNEDFVDDLCYNAEFDLFGYDTLIYFPGWMVTGIPGFDDEGNPVNDVDEVVGL